MRVASAIPAGYNGRIKRGLTLSGGSLSGRDNRDERGLQELAGFRQQLIHRHGTERDQTGLQRPVPVWRDVWQASRSRRCI